MLTRRILSQGCRLSRTSSEYLRYSSALPKRSFSRRPSQNSQPSVKSNVTVPTAEPSLRSETSQATDNSTNSQNANNSQSSSNGSNSSSSGSQSSSQQQRSFAYSAWEEFMKRPFTYIGILGALALYFTEIKILQRIGLGKARQKDNKLKLKNQDVIIVSKLNDKISGYQGEVISATEGAEAGAKWNMMNGFQNRLSQVVSDLTKDQYVDLVKIEARYRKTIAEINENERVFFKGMPSKIYWAAREKSKNATPDKTNSNVNASNEPNAEKANKIIPSDDGAEALVNECMQFLQTLTKKRFEAEISFMVSYLNILNTNQQVQLITAIEQESKRLSKLGSALPKMFSSDSKQPMSPSDISMLTASFPRGWLADLLTSKSQPHVFVLSFYGDVMASQVAHLREEITAVVSTANPKRGDKVVVLLGSGGGAVTGYGLAASQLQRVKDHGLHLTVCVDEVAASGGYMMAAVADTIVASPFAILGSIGVITTIPNFSERLSREGIYVDDVTGGKYKRTLTPYKKATNADRAKVQEDINVIHDLFKSFVAKQRPGLDIEKVATGEVWLGQEAVKKGLCDKISTSDDFLLDLRTKGMELYSVEHRLLPPKKGFEALFDDDLSVSFKTVIDSAVDMVAESVTDKMKTTFDPYKSLSFQNSGSGLPAVQDETNTFRTKYMAVDTSSASTMH